MSARDLVAARIARRARAFPDLDLAPLVLDGLSARDAALASAIDHAVARHWLTLVAVVETRLTRPWETLEPKLQAVLLVGAAQLLLMDRLPAHAVINEAVATAKRLVREKAGGLVNAVLRKTANLSGEAVGIHDPARRDEMPLAEGGARRLAEPVFAADPWLRFAQQTSHPEELIARWRRLFGDEATRRLALHDLVHAPIIIAGIPGSHPHCAPHEQPGFHVYTGPRSELDALLAETPAARVQDPASARPVESTRDLRASVIIDACAGKGTKTRQLAAAHPKARIIAADIEPARAAVLQRTFAGHDRVEVIPYDRLLALRPEADLLVLDVPCSNSGVLARRVEAKYRFCRETLDSLRDVQRQIVADTLALLAPSGCLLYATCSVDPTENEEQIEWIRRWHPLRTDRMECRAPAGGPGEPPTGFSDGGFHALLRHA